MSGGTFLWYEKSILGCWLWLGLCCGKKGLGRLWATFEGGFFNFLWEEFFISEKPFFTFFLCNFSVRTLQCFQKKKFIFFALKKLKKPPSKVAHNRPKPFFPQPSPSHSQQPKIDFSYHKNVSPSVCSLVCGTYLM